LLNLKIRIAAGNNLTLPTMHLGTTIHFVFQQIIPQINSRAKPTDFKTE